MTERRYDVDALRVIATGAVFLFHCAKFFDPEGWHLTDPHPTATARIFVQVTAHWLMPLFFVLSGMSTKMALASKTAGRFVIDRTLRLLVPFVFGVFVVVPPQVYVERLGDGERYASFFAFYPHYFDGLYGLGGNFAWMGLHLWYLGLLFAITLVLLPILRYVPRAPPRALLAVAIPTFVVEWAIAHGPLDFRDLGGWSPVAYVFFFLGGVALADRSLTPALRANAVAMSVLAVLCIGARIWAEGAPDAQVEALPLGVWRAIRALAGWSAILALLGWGVRSFHRGSPTMRILGEAAMPFYVLHQTVILLVAWAIYAWSPGGAAKYASLALVAFAITAIGSEIIRRVRPLRLAFGLKYA